MTIALALAASTATAAETFSVEGRGLLYVPGVDGYSDAIAEAQAQALDRCAPQKPYQQTYWSMTEKKIGYSYYIIAQAEFVCGSTD